jgi:Xaa-Pro dipeptidase
MGVRGAVGVDSLDSRISRELSSDFKLVDIGDELMRLRSIKDPDELEAMLMSIRITEETMGDVLGRGIVGMRERDAAALFYAGFMVRGAGDVAFKPIIASGENAAYPHHEPGPRVVGKGEFVVVDVGARYSLYCADITRTVATGPVDARLRDIYMAVLEAQRSAINAVSPGVPANQVDAAARGVLEEYGYGNYYIHSTGHGVGVVVHEKPYLGPTSGDTLRTGNVVTIEPGVYIKGLGGVRIEDMVLVTENGHRVLSNYPRDL